MPRKPSDYIRDANRELKVQNQMIDGLTYSTSKSKKGQTEGWWRDLTVGKSEYGRDLNPDGFRIDWEERHHQTGLNLYERYTEGMSPQQRQLVDDRLAAKGLYKGNNGLNRVDIPRRLHHSSKYPEYEGAHQVTSRLGIDSPKELERLSGMSSDLKIQELDKFIDNQVKHRTVAQQKFMEQFMLEPGNNSSTNVFGGNFSQQVLQTRDTKAATKAAKALKVDRKTLKKLALVGLAAPSVLGTAASAAETGIRTNTAVRSGNPIDWLQAGLSGASLAADGVPVFGELVSTPADAINVGIDTYRDPGFKAQPNALAARQQQLTNSLQVNPKPKPQPKSEAGYQTISRVAQQGLNALKSSAQNNINAALSAFGF
jgi:hypothetical protein